MELHLEDLARRVLPGGGFTSLPDGQAFRPDATAWAALALDAFDARQDLVARARRRLQEGQDADGRVSINSHAAHAFWPTSLALLAWHDCASCDEAKTRAIGFLVSTTGQHFEKPADSVTGHDTALRGWPWAERTHSWVEPTAMALMALSVTGRGAHLRAQEAARLLLDRQFRSGGWNYGNTSMFDAMLHPLPHTTGVALSALAGRVPVDRVQASIGYLRAQVGRLKTPLSLAWGILGLSAWGERPAEASPRIADALARREWSAVLNTETLCLLLLSQRAERGLIDLLDA